MTEDLNTNRQYTLPSIDPENENLLVVLDYKTTKDGILYSFQPFTKGVLLTSLVDIEEKDLLLSLCYIHPNKNSLLVRTNIVNPLYYKKGKPSVTIEGREYSIYGVGECFAKVLQILD